MTNKDLRSRLPFNALTLRILALLFMLLDHMWATVISGNLWMTCVGRLAFPIFAFQAAEGYYHTSDYKRYLQRLLLFGLISEIPFNLMLESSVFYPFHQNVMFTLAIGLAALHAANKVREGSTWKQRLLPALAVVGWCVLGLITLVDYGIYGVMMVLLFGLFRNFRGAWIGQLVGMVLINYVWMEGLEIPIGGIFVPLQAFAILALPLIWLYNGRRGPRNKVIQYGSYVFYPAHMLMLYLILQLR